jgi:hypothetical protein
MAKRVARLTSKTSKKKAASARGKRPRVVDPFPGPDPFDPFSPGRRSSAKRAISKKARPAASSKKSVGVTVPMHSVIHFVTMLQDEGHASAFIKGAKKAKATMMLDADSVAFVKSYLSGNQLHAAMVAKVVDPCPNDPFDCRFRD